MIYSEKFLEQVAFYFIIFGSISYTLYGFFKIDTIDIINKYSINGMDFALHFIIMSSIAYHLNRRDFHLPFLGNAVYPCTSLMEKTPKNASLSIELFGLTPNVNVVYWASEQINNKSDVIIDNPWDAYDEYSNSGVGKTDDKGYIVVRIRPPIQYRIPTGKILKKHLHYRECIGKGMLGPVKSHYIYI
jgi:hypothetical protein